MRDGRVYELLETGLFKHEGRGGFTSYRERDCLNTREGEGLRATGNGIGLNLMGGAGLRATKNGIGLLKATHPRTVEEKQSPKRLYNLNKNCNKYRH